MGKDFLADGSDELDDLDDSDDLDETEYEEIEQPPVGEVSPPPHRRRGPRPEPIRILFEDEHLVVVDKPAGLEVSGASRPGESLIDRVEGLCPHLADGLAFVHSLDRDASGALVLARTQPGRAELKRQWKQSRARVVYRAITQGVCEVESGTIDLRLVTTGRKTDPVAVGAKGRESITDYRLIEQFRQFAFLEASPQTEFMHQVRVHLAAIGLPLVGDTCYGRLAAIYLSQFKRRYKRSGREPERPLIDRLALHALCVSFVHPATGQPLTVEAPLPKDFDRTLAQLRKFGR